MTKRTALIAVAAAIVSVSFAAAAATRGTPAEAKAMLQKAVDHYEKVGRKQAIADFNAPIAEFKDRDLYAFCVAKDHTIIANGGFPSLVGTNGDALKDVDGRSMADLMWKAASEGGNGFVEYRWFSPVTHRIEPKISFVRKAGDDLCGVGAYNPAKSESTDKQK